MDELQRERATDRETDRGRDGGERQTYSTDRKASRRGADRVN